MRCDFFFFPKRQGPWREGLGARRSSPRPRIPPDFSGLPSFSITGDSPRSVRSGAPHLHRPPHGDGQTDRPARTEDPSAGGRPTPNFETRPPALSPRGVRTAAPSPGSSGRVPPPAPGSPRELEPRRRGLQGGPETKAAAAAAAAAAAEARTVPSGPAPPPPHRLARGGVASPRLTRGSRPGLPRRPQLQPDEQWQEAAPASEAPALSDSRAGGLQAS